MSATTTQPPTLAARVSEYGTIIVSAMVLAVYLIALVIAYLKANDTLLTTLLGIAGANATAAVQYWLGSSFGSNKKTDLMAGGSSAPPPAAP